jgi:hypothetical protein
MQRETTAERKEEEEGDEKKTRTGDSSAIASKETCLKVASPLTKQ